MNRRRPMARPMTRAELLAPRTERELEAPWQAAVWNWAGLGGWHGIAIFRSQGVLEGLHSKGRPFPRHGDHDDAYGWPDLALVHPERGELCLPELKTRTGDMRDGQKRWHGWLNRVRRVTSPIWRPADQDRVVAYLLARGKPMNPTETPISFYSLDTPLGPLMVVECRHPDANGERPDVPTGQQCPDHNRTVYLCLDNDAFWCDGYQGGDEYKPHELGLVADGDVLDGWIDQ